MPYLGELAALTTALCWAAGSLFFTRAARITGGFPLNQARITLAFVVLSGILLLTRGTAWAPGAGAAHYGLLALSGLIGLTFGDWGLFRAMADLGPRVATLFMTLAPPIAALLAVPVLGETLGWPGILGMSLTLAGVIWVVRERQPASTIPRGHRIRGILGGVLGASGQALGLVLSKLGMAEVIDPLPATAVRMGAATIGVWILAYTTGRRAGLGVLIRHPEARLATLAATLVGPVIGVWLSLVAVRHTHAGIAATLMALTPILVVPMVILIHRERVSPRAGIGALISVAGVALLFLRG